MLNKFTTFFFGAAVLAVLLATAPRALARRPVWVAVGLALLVCGPTLAWQVAHGLPFRHHMALLHDEQLVHVSAADFWRDQLLMCSAGLLVWVPGLAAALLGRPQPAARVVGVLYVAGLGLLTLLHGKSYYALGYYPALFAVGAVWWQARLAGGRWPARVVQVALLLVPVLLTVRLAPIIYPVLAPARMATLGQQPFYQKIGVFRGNDGRTRPLPQDYADMLGWRELADKTRAAYQALPDSARASVLIKCDNYGQAGAINYYNHGRGLPLATSFNGSYLYWFPARPARPWRYLLLVGEGHPDELRPWFRQWQQVGEVNNPYALERGTTIYLGTGPSAALLARIGAEHQAELARWEGK